MIKDINFDLVGNLIRKLRERTGLNQREFAKEMDVSDSAICQWEQGAGIKTENLYDIARYFNITVSELIDGKLNEEEDDDYFERNYNLDGFDSFDEIDETNYDELIEYLKRCKNVIKRFMMLYSLRTEAKLTKKQNGEYHRMSRYFKADEAYANTLNVEMCINSIEETIERLNDLYEISDRDELDYMLYKIFRLRINVNEIALLSYEKDDIAANEYLALIGKEHCDHLLTKLTMDVTDDEIEASLPIKRLIEYGARCFYTRKRLQSFEYNDVDEDVFKQLTGVSNNVAIQDKYDFFKQEEKITHAYGIYDVYSWKAYNRDGYEYLIDLETTDRIRDIVLLKDKEPKKYYKNLVERDAKLLGSK